MCLLFNDHPLYYHLINDTEMEVGLNASSTFAVADYIVFALLILISVGIGIFFACYGKGQHTTQNYFLGDRNMKVLPVALSYVVTFQSSLLVLGAPAEVYAYGMQYCLVCVGVTTSYLTATLIVVPLFHPLKITSVNEYFLKRYNSNIVRFLAVALGIIYYTFYMGIVVYGTSLALESTASFPIWASVLVFSSAAVLYTSIGGIKAVIWTDVFQTLVMFSGIIAVLVKTSMSSDGTKNIEARKSRLNFFNFDPDPTQRHTFWTLTVGAFPQFLYLTFSQSGIQRINSTPTINTAKQLYYIATPIFCAIWILAMFQGVTIYSYFYDKGCDPISSGQVQNLNQILPFTVMELFHDLPGLPGLFIAALAAASLSTLSSGLSSLAAVTYEDIIKVYSKSITEEKGTNISKVVVVLYGLVAMGFAFILSNVEGPIGQIFVSFMGAIAGPTTGLFLLSIFNRRTTTKGAVSGTLCAVVFVLWLSLGQNFSGSARQTEYLPLGPTDQCPGNTTDSGVDFRLATPIHVINTTTPDSSVEQLYNYTSETLSQTGTNAIRSSLSIFYSISYMYFDLIGVLVVLLIGNLVSLFTQTDVSASTHDKYVLPLSVFVPGFIRRNFCKCKKKEKLTIDTHELERMVKEDLREQEAEKIQEKVTD